MGLDRDGKCDGSVTGRHAQNLEGEDERLARWYVVMYRPASSIARHAVEACAALKRAGIEGLPVTVCPAAQELVQLGAEVFCPTMTRRVVDDGGERACTARSKGARRPGMRIDRHVALFPGYLFVRIGAVDPLDLPDLPHYVEAVLRGASERAFEVPAPVVEALRNVVDVGAAGGPWQSGYVPGQELRIVAGPWAGLHGMYVCDDGPGRIKMLVDLLRRFVPVSLSSESVEPANQQA